MGLWRGGFEGARFRVFSLGLWGLGGCLYNAVMEDIRVYTAESLYKTPIWGFIQRAV